MVLEQRVRCREGRGGSNRQIGANLTGEMLLLPGANVYTAHMDRVVHKAKNFAAAAQWDIEQQIQMTPQERQLIARRLRERVYGRKIKDVRACHATK